MSDNPDVSHEARDISVKAILWIATGLVVAAVAIHLFVWLVFTHLEKREAARVPPRYPLASAVQDRLPPEPRLQTTPRQDLQKLRAAEDAILNSAGWVDKNTSVVRIPIEHAMALTVERGLPTRPPEDRKEAKDAPQP
jgi:hypothetical protein